MISLSPNRHDTTKGWTDPTATDGLILRMPVYVLTSSSKRYRRLKISPMGCRRQKEATIAGEKTAGGCPSNGRTGFSGSWLCSRHSVFAHTYNIHTGTDWEGTGVIPDVALKADASLDEVTFNFIPGFLVCKSA